jgi:hypothetical protein
MVARAVTAPCVSEVPANVLTLLAVGLTIWLGLGALVAQLFGAGGLQSREDEDDLPEHDRH